MVDYDAHLAFRDEVGNVTEVVGEACLRSGVCNGFVRVAMQRCGTETDQTCRPFVRIRLVLEALKGVKVGDHVEVNGGDLLFECMRLLRCTRSQDKDVNKDLVFGQFRPYCLYLLWIGAVTCACLNLNGGVVSLDGLMGIVQSFFRSRDQYDLCSFCLSKRLCYPKSYASRGAGYQDGAARPII